jgi:hypothetical protein
MHPKVQCFFCKNTAAALRYIEASNQKLLEGANAPPEKLPAIEKESNELLEIAKKYSEAAGPRP